MKKQKKKKQRKKQENFWWTVFKVEVADIAFAVDSILAAVALAMTLPKTGLGTIGSLDTGQFAVIFVGGLIGLIIMRFAATAFVQILKRKPGLETAAFLIVGWVGVKLAVYTLAHPALNVIPHSFPESTPWKLTFWIVLVGIAVGGWFFSKEVEVKSRKEFRRKKRCNYSAFFFFLSSSQCPEKNSIILPFVNVFLMYVCPFCETLHKLIESENNSMYFIHIRSIYRRFTKGAYYSC